MLSRFMLFSAAVILCASAHADVVQLQPVADNTLYENATGALSSGAGGAFFAGRNSGMTNSVRRGVIRFDLASSIPAGSTITGVELRLVESGNNMSPRQVNVHRLLQSWGEGASAAGGASGGGGGAPAEANDATWLHRFFNSELWATPGGSFDPLSSASTLVEGPGAYTWLSTLSLIADAQSFLDSPATNFGWAVVGDESVPSTSKRFLSREFSDESLRPLLTITYIPSPGAALPGMVLVGAAGRRRRRN
ncbi:MAG: DNRLRE domain-containing protein [Phycisphaerales bacterium]